MGAIIRVKSGYPTHTDHVEFDADDFEGAEDFGYGLYKLTVETGLIMVPVAMAIEGAEAEFDVSGWTIEQIFQVVEWSASHGEAFGIFLELGMHTESDPDLWEDEFTESYEGEWESEGAWLENRLDEVGEAPNPYLAVDWEESFRYGGFNTEYTFEKGYMFRTV